MNLNEMIMVKGCITQEHFLRGRTLSEIERILGFHKGRLNEGMIVAALIELPSAHQFDLLGYTQVAEHRFKGIDPAKLDEKKLKEMVMKEAFTLSGYKRLVKVIANKPHDASMDDDTQYPPGLGVPQWKLTTRLPARVLKIINPGKIYF
jgi:hypothetical protein